MDRSQNGRTIFQHGYSENFKPQTCRLFVLKLYAEMLFGGFERLMFGFMLPTWFLSMWVSNTATTAMMIPIVGAVLDEFKLVKKASQSGKKLNKY